MHQGEAPMRSHRALMLHTCMLLRLLLLPTHHTTTAAPHRTTTTGHDPALAAAPGHCATQRQRHPRHDGRRGQGGGGAGR